MLSFFEGFIYAFGCYINFYENVILLREIDEGLGNGGQSVDFFAELYIDIILLLLRERTFFTSFL